MSHNHDDDICADLDCEFLLVCGGCELDKTPDDCYEATEANEKHMAEGEAFRETLREARREVR